MNYNFSIKLKEKRGYYQTKGNEVKRNGMIQKRVRNKKQDQTIIKVKAEVAQKPRRSPFSQLFHYFSTFSTLFRCFLNIVRRFSTYLLVFYVFSSVFETIIQGHLKINLRKKPPRPVETTIFQKTQLFYLTPVIVVIAR